MYILIFYNLIKMYNLRQRCNDLRQRQSSPSLSASQALNPNTQPPQITKTPVDIIMPPGF